MTPEVRVAFGMVFVVLATILMRLSPDKPSDGSARSTYGRTGQLLWPFLVYAGGAWWIITGLIEVRR